MFLHSNFEQPSVPYAKSCLCFTTHCSDSFRVRWKIFRPYMSNLLKILYQKLLKIIWFLTEIFKSKVVDVFFRNTVYYTLLSFR